MFIDRSYLNILDVVDTNVISFRGAVNIIKKHYCDPMNVHGCCPGHCPHCEEGILSLFPINFARNPQALLVWRCKDLFAKANEMQHAKIDFTASERTEEDQGNPFDVLAGSS